MRNAECLVRNAECETRDIEHGMPNLLHGTRYASEKRDMDRKILFGFKAHLVTHSMSFATYSLSVTRLKWLKANDKRHETLVSCLVFSIVGQVEAGPLLRTLFVWLALLHTQPNTLKCVPC